MKFMKVKALLIAASLLQSAIPLFGQALPVPVPAPIPMPPATRQPTDAGQPIPLLSPNELDGLVSTIALYPDPLISQILVAATYPLEIVEASQWLQRNPGLTGPALTQAAAGQNWDPSIQALVMFPDVIQRLNEDITWTTNLGNAFLAQQADVMSAIQRMRLSAQQAGKLATTPQQQVATTYDAGQPVVVIMPANPEVIYVPVYDPLWVWGPARYYPYARWYYPPVRRTGLFFNVGISVGGFLGGGWGGWGVWGWSPAWRTRTIVVNNTFIRRYNFNTTRIVAAGPTSIWAHDAFHRHGVPYPTARLNEQFRSNVRLNLRPAVRPAVVPAPARALAARPAPPQPLRAAPRVVPNERLGNRAVAPEIAARNRSAFSGIENGNTARLHSEQGYSSLGPSRSAGHIPQPAPPARHERKGKQKGRG
jgi:hypothetical protein